MKITPVVLLLSVVANVALGVVWLQRSATPPSPAPVASAPVAPVSPPQPTPLNQETWSKLNAANDAEFVAQLRAEGFPPRMLFALVGMRVRAHYADILKKLRPPADYAYWRSQGFGQDDSSPETRAARREIDRAIAEERKQLLGADADLATPAERASRERAYGNIPAGKVDQLSAINRDYSEMTAQVRDRAKGVTLPEDREQLALLEREKRADLVKLLTPAELAEYDVRASQSASTLQYRLRFFEPSEDEYRALVALQLAFDQRYGAGHLLNAEQLKQRTEAESDLAAQMRAVLPPDRLAAYDIRTDPLYTRMSYLVQSLNLPTTAADDALTVQRGLVQRYDSIRQNRTLAPDQRETQLAVLAQEATARLTVPLGDAGFARYKQQGGPLNSLLNRPARKP